MNLKTAYRRILRKCLPALLLLAPLAVRAVEPSLNATLSSATADIGEAVTLHVEIQGVSGIQPPQIAVEGIDIQFNGASTQFQMNNAQVSQQVTLTYTLLPQRSGTFTLPTMQIQAGGKTLSTRPLTLTISTRTHSAATAGNSGNAHNADAGTDAELAIAEWVVPQKIAYVGEAIPTDLRVYLRDGIRWDLESMPIVNGDGFTIANLTKPAVSDVTRNGQAYKLVVFKTAVTPVKTGTLVLPATDVHALAVLPQRVVKPSLNRGFPDIFNDPFFQSALQPQQRVTIRSSPLELAIKPLPVENRPADFDGAIGQFKLAASAAPLRVHAGDPITVKTEISGVGNFDRLGAPVLEDAPGWKSYPPSGKFQPGDAVGISGVKTFEMAVISDAPRTALPKIRFTYFDPAQERYVTLTEGPLAVTIEGSVAAAPVATPLAGASPEPPVKPNDIQFIRFDFDLGVASLPVLDWRSRVFWEAQIVPLVALLLAAGWLHRKNRRGDLQVRRAAELADAKADAWRMLNWRDTSSTDFYTAAVRLLQLETALTTGREPATCDAGIVCASRSLDAPTMNAITDLFAAHDHLRYAGAGENAPLPAERQKSIRKLLREFEKNHG